jgi:hypothetical protein
MYSHDPLCPWNGSTEWDQLIACDDCNLIAKVRQDQTQHNIKQVQRMCAHTKYEGCRPCMHDDLAASFDAVLCNDSAPDPATGEPSCE